MNTPYRIAWIRNGKIENVTIEDVPTVTADGFECMLEEEAIAKGIPYLVAGEEPRTSYRDPIEGTELDTSPAAQSRFTSLVALIREGLDFGALTNESKQEIRDVHGVTHSLTVVRIRALMLRYGLHCKALFDQSP